MTNPWQQLMATITSLTFLSPPTTLAQICPHLLPDKHKHTLVLEDLECKATHLQDHVQQESGVFRGVPAWVMPQLADIVTL